MSLTNRYIVLFFSAGIVPSPAELEAARDLGPNVRWRNVAHHVEGSVEPCTAVAGLVPDDYLVHYPRAVSYVDWIGGKLPVVVPPPPPAEPDGAIDAAAFLGPAPGSAKPRTRGNSGAPPLARAPSAMPPVELPRAPEDMTWTARTPADGLGPTSVPPIPAPTSSSLTGPNTSPSTGSPPASGSRTAAGPQSGAPSPSSGSNRSTTASTKAPPPPPAGGKPADWQPNG